MKMDEYGAVTIENITYPITDSSRKIVFSNLVTGRAWGAKTIPIFR